MGGEIASYLAFTIELLCFMREVYCDIMNNGLLENKAEDDWSDYFPAFLLEPSADVTSMLTFVSPTFRAVGLPGLSPHTNTTFFVSGATGLSTT